MPFPLAHPAAILPLRRWCPRYLDFPALVIGSLAPDLAASIDDWEYFSHTLAGSFVFCLPAGLLTLWLLYELRGFLVPTLPNPHRDALLPLCTSPKNSTGPVVASLLLGAWLHIGWDQFTHDHSGLVRSGAWFAGEVGGIVVNRVIWLVSTIVGSGMVVGLYAARLRKSRLPWFDLAPAELRRYALWCGFLLFPVAGAIPLAIQDSGWDASRVQLLRVFVMFYQGCLYATLAAAGFVLRYRKISRQKPAPSHERSGS